MLSAPRVSTFLLLLFHPAAEAFYGFSFTVSAGWVFGTLLSDLRSWVNAQIVYPASHAVVKPNELYSALARPLMTATYEPDRPVTYLAATLAYGIIQGHPFFDGNKRTAFFLANEFMRICGLRGLTAQDGDTLTPEELIRLADRHISVAQGNLGVDGLEYKLPGDVGP